MKNEDKIKQFHFKYKQLFSNYPWRIISSINIYDVTPHTLPSIHCIHNLQYRYNIHHVLNYFWMLSFVWIKHLKLCKTEPMNFTISIYFVLIVCCFNAQLSPWQHIQKLYAKTWTSVWLQRWLPYAKDRRFDPRLRPKSDVITKKTTTMQQWNLELRCPKPVRYLIWIHSPAFCDIIT